MCIKNCLAAPASSRRQQLLPPSGSDLAALALVSDRRRFGIALQVRRTRRKRSPDLAATFLHAGAAVGQPVDIDQGIVRAAIGFTRGDRRWELNVGVRGRVGRVVGGFAARDDGVAFLVAAGKRSGRNERDDERSGASHDPRPARPEGQPSRPSACILSKWDIASSIAMPYQPGSSAQRIRIGLTSLAFVFLIVLIASVINRSSKNDTSNAAQQAVANEPG